MITGATGFIGTHLIRSLKSNGVSVIALVRPDTRPELSVRTIEAALHDVSALTRAMQGVDIVYHLAGTGSPATAPSHYDSMIQTNISGTLNVLSAAVEAGVSRVILASSASVYGSLSSSALHEDMIPQPVSVYGITKLATEQLGDMFTRTFGLSTVALRLFNVYGPGDDRNGRDAQLIPTLLKRIREGKPCTIYGDGKQTRDFIYIDDAVRALVLAGVVDDTQHMILNVGTGSAVRISDLLPALANTIGVQPSIMLAPSRPGEVRHSVADTGRMSAVLRFRPAITIEEGLAWYIAEDHHAEVRPVQ